MARLVGSSANRATVKQRVQIRAATEESEASNIIRDWVRIANHLNTFRQMNCRIFWQAICTFSPII